MSKDIILRVITATILPLIVLFGLYVLLGSKTSPGGGFQGGAIWATAFCLYALVYSQEKIERIFPVKTLKIIACTGCAVYCGIGLLTIFLGGNFLDYNMLSKATAGQQIGIMAVEISVQLTVFAVLSLIFSKLFKLEKL